MMHGYRLLDAGLNGLKMIINIDLYPVCTIKNIKTVVARGFQSSLLNNKKI